jgi:redox-sensitive bicupin YhaK (pirin superfamily)
MLFSGQHVAYELPWGRRAWVHAAHGEVTVGDHVLTAGDGVAFVGEHAASFTARGEAEILLLDFAEPPPSSGAVDESR